jgi:hypothetical protein
VSARRAEFGGIVLLGLDTAWSVQSSGSRVVSAQQGQAGDTGGGRRALDHSRPARSIDARAVSLTVRHYRAAHVASYKMAIRVRHQRFNAGHAPTLSAISHLINQLAASQSSCFIGGLQPHDSQAAVRDRRILPSIPSIPSRPPPDYDCCPHSLSASDCSSLYTPKLPRTCRLTSTKTGDEHHHVWNHRPAQRVPRSGQDQCRSGTSVRPSCPIPMQDAAS